MVLKRGSALMSQDRGFSPIICIVGPTASGKSSLAQKVALNLGGEVVSADSMQIYRGMDIGTAKLTAKEMYVPHHLIDIVDPGEPFSAQVFQERARTAFRDIQDRERIALLCGGTGLYVQAALEAMEFPAGEQRSNPLREHYEGLVRERGAQYLWDHLAVIDSASARLIHPNNTRRVIRALEMNHEGVSYAHQVQNLKSLDEVVPSLRFGLKVDPDVLNRRIERRVDMMMEKGLVGEVTSLLRQGFEGALTAPQAIGYKEIVSAFKDGTPIEEAFDRIKTATRRYAKRQRSWFKRDNRIVWLDTDENTEDEMCEKIEEAYRRFLLRR